MCIDAVNKANAQLGGENSCYLNTIYNNVYPVRISSKPLADFIIKWTKWERGTYCYNKKLNMELLKEIGRKNVGSQCIFTITVSTHLPFSCKKSILVMLIGS